MDSFTLNKAAGAVLMVLILTMGVGIVSDIIFHPTIPGKPGYEIVVASTGDSTSEVEAVPEVEPISERLIAAAATDGEKVAKKCAACHTFEQGGANKVGPALWDVIGRKPAGVDGFGYSAAMTEFGAQNAEWTYENLDLFLASPKNYISGTSMGFAGLRKPEERADMIAYLREQADTPKPLPEPEAATEEAAADAPAEESATDAPAEAAAEAPAADSEAPAAEAEAPADESQAPAAETEAPASQTTE